MADQGGRGSHSHAPRAGSGDEGVQSYRAPDAGAAEEKAPSSVGAAEHAEASLHPPERKQPKRGRR